MSGSARLPALQSVNSLEESNQYLRKVGHHAEPLGSDALQRWILESGVQEMNGGYWQMRQLATGETAMVQVSPPKEVLEANTIDNAKLSQIKFRTFNRETRPQQEGHFQPSGIKRLPPGTLGEGSKRRKQPPIVENIYKSSDQGNRQPIFYVHLK